MFFYFKKADFAINLEEVLTIEKGKTGNNATIRITTKSAKQEVVTVPYSCVADRDADMQDFCTFTQSQ